MISQFEKFDFKIGVLGQLVVTDRWVQACSGVGDNTDPRQESEAKKSLLKAWIWRAFVTRAVANFNFVVTGQCCWSGKMGNSLVKNLLAGQADNNDGKYQEQ